jgi:trehalose 6-phosphate phosphatase
MDQWRDGEIEALPEARAYRPALEHAIVELQLLIDSGMMLEDKGVTLALHYRLSQDPDRRAAELAPLVEAVAAANGLRVFAGRKVFELRPPLDIDKGIAFARLIGDHALDAAVYLGDDTTDADALRTARHLREAGEVYALGVGVASDETPSAVADSADWLVSGVSGVEWFLEALANALSASST